jgi:hypothetical protein
VAQVSWPTKSVASAAAFGWEVVACCWPPPAANASLVPANPVNNRRHAVLVKNRRMRIHLAQQAVVFGASQNPWLAEITAM